LRDSIPREDEGFGKDGDGKKLKNEKSKKSLKTRTCAQPTGALAQMQRPTKQKHRKKGGQSYGCT